MLLIRNLLHVWKHLLKILPFSEGHTVPYESRHAHRYSGNDGSCESSISLDRGYALYDLLLIVGRSELIFVLYYPLLFHSVCIPSEGTVLYSFAVQNQLTWLVNVS